MHANHDITLIVKLIITTYTVYFAINNIYSRSFVREFIGNFFFICIANNQ